FARDVVLEFVEQVADGEFWKQRKFNEGQKTNCCFRCLFTRKIVSSETITIGKLLLGFHFAGNGHAEARTSLHNTLIRHSPARRSDTSPCPLL
ncbi:MAG: hypothetical protein AAB380_04250, partial [Verrucomicrobiota bacterium]